MNPLAIITWFVVACTVVGMSAGVAAIVVERRRQRTTPDATEQHEPLERTGPGDVWIELAEQRRELDELRDKIARLEEQPG